MSTWIPVSQPPDSERQVIIALKWHHYDGTIDYIVTMGAYSPGMDFWAMGDVINAPDEVLRWQEMPALPEGLK
jgi:hypothetical protein